MKSPLIYFNILMTLIYFSVGVVCFFTNVLIDMLPDNRKLVGGIFLGYSVFRIIITVQKLKKANDNNEG